MLIDPTGLIPTKASLNPDYRSPSDAAAAGYRRITTPICTQHDADIAQSVHSTLSGVAPGSKPVEFAIVSEGKDQISFARPVGDLRDSADAGQRSDARRDEGSELAGPRPAGNPEPMEDVSDDCIVSLRKDGVA